MSQQDQQATTVRILDRDYHVACAPEERESLAAAARYLDGKMREIRDRGKVVGLDRIAVMAALNIANEFLGSRGQSDEYVRAMTQRIRALQDRIESALNNGAQMDL